MNPYDCYGPRICHNRSVNNLVLNLLCRGSGWCCFSSLVSWMWQDKKVVKLSPDDNMHMEGFALSVFAKADKQDRAGRADVYRLISPIYTAICLFQ
jgi:hypothetical protein